MKLFIQAICVAASFACLMPKGAQSEAQTQTLSDALVTAYRNSNILEQERATLRAADEGLAQALSSLRPVIDFAARKSWDSRQSSSNSGFIDTVSSSLSLTASITLLDFGRSALQQQRQKEFILIAREALRNVEQNVLLSAVSVFVDYQLKEKVIELRRSNVRLVEQQLSAARDRFTVGEITRTDVAITEARLAAATAGLEAAQGDLFIASQAFKVSIGSAPGKLSALPPTPELPKSLDAAISLALRNHPLIRQAQHNAAITDTAVELARANYRPTLSATATLGRDNLGRDSQNLGVVLNQRLYSGGRESSLLREAIANQKGAYAQLAQTGLTVTQALSNAWAILEVSKARVTAGELQIKSAQTAFNGVREEASLGVRTTLDVLNAEQELLDARFSKLDAEAQRYVAVYQVLQNVGLLNTQHLGLDTPVYDPEAYFKKVQNAPVHTSRGARLDKILGTINP